MSVLIKCAKPPSGCRWCYFNEDSKCALIVGCDFDDTDGSQRRENCPLIELPDHGDLIDRDKLLKKKMKMDAFAALEWVSDVDICLERTVIPAERSEDVSKPDLGNHQRCGDSL